MECFVIVLPLGDNIGLSLFFVLFFGGVVLSDVSQPEVSHSFPHSMFAHVMRLKVPSKLSIIVTERQQFWVLVPLSVFQESSHVNLFPADSQYCWLYVFCKLEQINHRASGNSQIGEEPSGARRYYNFLSRSNYVTRSMMTFTLCSQVLTQNLRTRACWFKPNLHWQPHITNLMFILLIKSVIPQCKLMCRKLRVWGFVTFLKDAVSDKACWEQV